MQPCTHGVECAQMRLGSHVAGSRFLLEVVDMYLQRPRHKAESMCTGRSGVPARCACGCAPIILQWMQRAQVGCSLQGAGMTAS